MINVACKWVSTVIAIGIFLGLISVAGNVHVAEFFGSLVIGLISGGAFYLTICRGKKKNA